jgi:Na+/H+-translocating membrane pyrophosphatase
MIMEDMVLFSLLSGLVALVFALISAMRIMREDPGTPTMRKILGHEKGSHDLP